jgi:hypothetical protein
MPAPAAPAAVPGHAVLARVEGRALVIWDSTLEVAQIVKDKLPDAAAKDRLERDALGELLLEAPNLGRARSVDVRVVYTKTGDVSPVYGSPEFAGVERYATLTMPAADVKRDRGRWQEAATGGGALPAWIEFSISGELPPR